MDDTEQLIKHYVCSECGTTSINPGNCQADFCILQGSPLKECHCNDGKHDGVKSNWNSEDGPKEDATIVDDGVITKPITTLDLDAESQ